MHIMRFNRKMIFIYIFSLIICGICFEYVPNRTGEPQNSVSMISSNTRLDSTKVKYAVCTERFSERAETRGLMRNVGRRINNTIRFTFPGRELSDVFLRTFSMTKYLRSCEVRRDHNSHNWLLRYLYRKDGKKNPRMF